MTTCSITRLARAPVARVFEMATDLRRAPERIPAIVKIDVLTPGPVQKGTRFRETRKMFGKEATEEMEILEFDAPRSYVLGAESCGCRFRTALRFVPKESGTEMTMEIDTEPLTFFAKVMGVLMKPMMKKMMKECGKDLDALAAAAEGG